MTPAPFVTDTLVIGAGPVGLFQVFQLGLMGLRCHVVDALPAAGGQCATLYADKPIYDIPGLPRCTAIELIERLQQQIQAFDASFHWSQCIQSVERQGDGRLLLSSDRGQAWLVNEVFIAAGMGAFVPRKLSVEGIERFEARQLHYYAPDAKALAGQHVIVVGDGNEALRCALELSSGQSNAAAQVTLLYRREVLRADEPLVRAMRERCAANAMQFVVGQITAFEERSGQLSGVTVLGPDGQTQALGADHLIVLQGLNPKLGPLLDWGLLLDHKLISVDTAKFQTSVPGIYAVGDVNTYPGKRKLIVCGFHEATLAAYDAAARHSDTGSVPLLYTTTSPALHRRLGVSD